MTERASEPILHRLAELGVEKHRPSRSVDAAVAQRGDGVEQAGLDGAAEQVGAQEVTGLVRHHRPAVLGVEDPRDRLRRQAAQQRAVGQGSAVGTPTKGRGSTSRARATARPPTRRPPAIAPSNRFDFGGANADGASPVSRCCVAASTTFGSGAGSAPSADANARSSPPACSSR